MKHVSKVLPRQTCVASLVYARIVINNVHRALSALAFCGVLCYPIVALCAGDTVGAHQQFSILNTLSQANAHPSASVIGRNDERLLVVWDGLVRGQRRILLKERVAREWLPEVIIDDDRPGDNYSPVIVSDEAGVTYVAWISHSDVLGDQVLVTARVGDTWSSPLLLAVAPRGAEIRELNMALTSGVPPTLWFAWQIRGQGGDRISAARLTDRGEVNTWELSSPVSASQSPNLGLQLSMSPSGATLLWNAPFESEFIPIQARFRAESNAWDLTPNIPYLSQLPSTPTMPLYLLHAGTVIGHLAFDQMSHGETVVRGQRLAELETSSQQRVFFAFPPLFHPQVAWSSGNSSKGLTIAVSGVSETSGPVLLAQHSHGPEGDGPSPVGSETLELSLPPQAWPPTSLVVYHDEEKRQSFIVFSTDFDKGADGNIYFVDSPFAN